ncbi:hypothetical protein [Streptomyces sp. CL12-4]|uniref:hypothetical protein n=1 Tax=Streptomyces sp. CL12-4 TaxID=2810306 RepID=UPI001EFA5E14|nr:hypothetical protein [Streptomyces sp. CL12-4]MCG8971781.1 hypothetical protein [Streptomyces sp. CL12-4]
MTARYTPEQFLELLERRRRGGQASQPAAAAAPRKKAPKKPPAHPGLPSVPPPPAVEPLLAMLPNPGRHWTLLMPYAEKMLTSNDRHPNWQAEHRIRKELRTAATSLIRPMRVPRLQYAAIFFVLHPRSVARSRDPLNWAPTVKAYVDGLVTPDPKQPQVRHLLPDDDAEHLFGPVPVMGEPVPSGLARMSLVIVELSGPVTSANAKTVTGIADPTY